MPRTEAAGVLPEGIGLSRVGTVPQGFVHGRRQVPVNAGEQPLAW